MYLKNQKVKYSLCRTTSHYSSLYDWISIINTLTCMQHFKNLVGKDEAFITALLYVVLGETACESRRQQPLLPKSSSM